VTFEDKWTWKKKVEHDRAITYLEKRAYSFTGWANESIHAMAIKDLREENLVISEVEDRISLIVLDLNAGHST